MGRNQAQEGIKILENYLDMPWLPHEDAGQVSGKKHLIYTHPGFPWADTIDTIYQTQVHQKVPKSRTDRSWGHLFPGFFNGETEYEYDLPADIRTISSQLLEALALVSPEMLDPQTEHCYPSDFSPEKIIQRNRVTQAIGTFREMIREALLLKDVVGTDNLVVTMLLGVPTLDPDRLKNIIGNPEKNTSNTNSFLFTKALSREVNKKANLRFAVTSSYHAPEHGFDSAVYPKMGFPGRPAAPEKPDDEEEKQALWEQHLALIAAAEKNPQVYLTGSYVDQCCAHTLSAIYKIFDSIKFPFNLATAYGNSPYKFFVDPRLKRLLLRLEKIKDLKAARRVLSSSVFNINFPTDNSSYFAERELKDQHMFRDCQDFWHKVDLSATNSLKNALF